MQFLIDFVPNNLNYWWVFVFMAIESSFIPFPSEVVVPPAAFLAMMDDSHLNIIMVIVVATLGADVGALVNYYLAKWLGRPIVYRFADSRLVLERIADQIARFGAGAEQGGVGRAFFQHAFDGFSGGESPGASGQQKEGRGFFHEGSHK